MLAFDDAARSGLASVRGTVRRSRGAVARGLTAALLATGIAGGVLVLSGITALVVRRVSRGEVSKVALHPTPTLTGGSLQLTTRF